MVQRTPADLVEWASAQGIQLVLHDELPRVHTVAEAAAALGVSHADIAKSVVFATAAGPLVVLAPGDARVRDRLVLDHVGGTRNSFRMARPDEVLEWTDYPIGGVPPFGHPRPIRTLIDERLLARDNVVFGGGTDRSLITVAVADVRRVTAAEPGRFTD